MWCPRGSLEKEGQSFMPLCRPPGSQQNHLCHVIMGKTDRTEVLLNASQYEFRTEKALQIRDLSNLKLFGRPGHGAPTENIRKKKFTEHQLTDSSENCNQPQQQRTATAAELAAFERSSSSARTVAADDMSQQGWRAQRALTFHDANRCPKNCSFVSPTIRALLLLYNLAMCLEGMNSLARIAETLRDPERRTRISPAFYRERRYPGARE